MNITDGREESNRQTNYDFNIDQTQWSQVTPQYMPWGHNPSSPAAPLVTFTARTPPQQHEPGPSGLNYKSAIVSHCKRKAELNIAPYAVKQHITEERMAAHMSRLHISSESGPESSTGNIEEAAHSRQQRLYVCEEMRRLQTESILPSALLGRLERPCMAVMLWQPPPKVPDLLPPSLAAAVAAASRSQQTNNNNTDVDNNNSSVVDLNNMDMDT